MNCVILNLPSKHKNASFCHRSIKMHLQNTKGYIRLCQTCCSTVSERIFSFFLIWRATYRFRQGSQPQILQDAHLSKNVRKHTSFKVNIKVTSPILQGNMSRLFLLTFDGRHLCLCWRYPSNPVHLKTGRPFSCQVFPHSTVDAGNTSYWWISVDIPIIFQ